MLLRLLLSSNSSVIRHRGESRVLADPCGWWGVLGRHVLLKVVVIDSHIIFLDVLDQRRSLLVVVIVRPFKASLVLSL